MLKFYNETAAITYRPDTSIVHVVFSDSGSYNDYSETIQIAEGIAKVHHSSAYLLEKKEFNNLSVQEYGDFSLQWMARLDARVDTRQSIALLVMPSAFSPLLDYYHDCGMMNHRHVIYNVFVSPNNGIKFLRAIEA